MTAGEGEDSGLHAGPQIPETALPPERAVTQPLPMVRREGSTEPPSVRAVARRVASALPALGHADAAGDTPHSARMTADRRRQARAAARGSASGTPTPRPIEGESPPSDKKAPASDQKAPASDQEVSASDQEVSASDQLATASEKGALSDPSALGDERPSPESAAELEPVVEADRAARARRAIELVIEPLAVADTGQADGDRPAPEPVVVVSRPRSHGTPLSQGGPVSAPLMGQPPRAGDVLDAEIVDDPPALGRTGMSAAAAEVVTALTEVAFREARTDEWIMGPPEPVVEPSAGVLVDLRPGPSVLGPDSWDPDDLPVPQHDAYQGRRRAASSTRLWLVIGLVIAALGTAIAVPFLLTSGTPEPIAVLTPNASASSDQGASTLTSSPAPESSSAQTGLPVIGASPLVTSSTPTTPPVLLTVQAEQGGSATAWGGTSDRASFAGATVIDELGEHWPGTSIDGWLEFRNITGFDAGPYVLKIYYVYTNQPPEAPRPVNGVRSMNVTVNGNNVLRNQQFSPVSTITVLNVNVTLRASSNTIRLTHSNVECPAIDRIEITRT